MADGFEAMVDAAVAFFTELQHNNSKDWFAPRKDQYTNDIKKPAEFFADLVAEDLSRILGAAHKPKVFRIYRDVRFSKDKTPLKTNLHMMFAPVSAGPLSPKWFWGLSPEYFLVGVGVMGLQSDGLTAYRQHIDRHGETVQAAMEHISDIGGGLSAWGQDPLKRVPKPYAQDHPQAELLKRKSLTVTAPIAHDWRDTGVLKATEQRIKDMKPFVDAFAE